MSHILFKQSSRISVINVGEEKPAKGAKVSGGSKQGLRRGNSHMNAFNGALGGRPHPHIGCP